MSPSFRSDSDISELPDESSQGEVIFTLNKLLNSYNVFNRSISIQSNFDGFIAEDVEIAAGATANIQHFLGIKPKWRIILRQVGNGVITDIPSDWSDKVISLKNNGAEAVTISVFIARE